MYQENNLGIQSVLATASAGVGDTVPPHHPITCVGKELGFGEDGSLWCPHAKVEGNEARLHAAIVHSIACLIIEQAFTL